MEQMKADMKELMEGSGPFGRQITGGNNLGENEERFYIQDDLNYYGVRILLQLWHLCMDYMISIMSHM